VTNDFHADDIGVSRFVCGHLPLVAEEDREFTDAVRQALH
jgi:hypothetical protein